ncbi:MAG TPA: hypothetical protein VGL53_14285 [Bryobacteraceae bacterium]|jgi:hypothetical protein
MALPVNELKSRLVTERDLTKLWHSFMDMTQMKEFQETQRPCKDLALCERIGEISGKIGNRLPLKGSITLALFELPPYDLVHGPVTLPTGLGNVFYFRGIDAGLFAIPNGASTHPVHQWTMVRFSIGKPLARAAGASGFR